MKQVNFTNIKTNSKISLSLDKKMIFVFGKNGSGKTTLSRSDDLKMKKCFIFNEDFIYKNIHIIDKEGPQINQATSNNFCELLIGENIIISKKKLLNMMRN